MSVCFIYKLRMCVYICVYTRNLELPGVLSVILLDVIYYHMK